MRYLYLFFTIIIFTFLNQAYAFDKTTCTQADKNEIEHSMKGYMSKTGVQDYNKVVILSKRCFNGYAQAIVHPKTPIVEDATVYLKKINGHWQVLNWGTDFDSNFLAKIPKELR